MGLIMSCVLTLIHFICIDFSVGIHGQLIVLLKVSKLVLVYYFSILAQLTL